MKDNLTTFIGPIEARVNIRGLLRALGLVVRHEVKSEAKNR